MALTSYFMDRPFHCHKVYNTCILSEKMSGWDSNDPKYEATPIPFSSVSYRLCKTISLHLVVIKRMQLVQLERKKEFLKDETFQATALHSTFFPYQKLIIRDWLAVCLIEGYD